VLGAGSLVVAHDCPGFGLTQRPAGVSNYTVGFNGRVGRSLLEAEVGRRHTHMQLIPESSGVSLYASDGPQAF
jgi:hypothetical protein